jgi:hypothetical protein
VYFSLKFNVLTLNIEKPILHNNQIFTTMGSLTNLGKYLFLVPFLMFGINHFTKADMMSGMVPSFIPGGAIWVYVISHGGICSQCFIRQV